MKWVLNTGYAVENPPLIVGNTVYAQNNALQVIAIDLSTGLSKWKYDPGVPAASGLLPRASSSHGMVFENGIIYAPTGPNGTVVALNSQNGAKIWETEKIDIGPAWRLSAPPVIWNNIIIAGSALGDEPPFGVAQKGTVTGIDKATGKKLWQTQLAVGAWVTTSPNATLNGGATTWTGGAIDTEKGVIYLPIGNPSPDFQPEVRTPGPNQYSNSVIGLNITDGKILWATPFIAEGTVLPNVTTLPDGHDWDCSWGTNLVTVDMGNGPQKVVIGHDKRGDVMAMDAATGKPIWWVTLTYLQNENQQPSAKGTDIVWPGPGAGIEAFTATDGKYVYAAASNTPVRYYNGPPDPTSGLLSEGGAVPAFDAIDNGYGNGSISAIDLKTGKIAWRYPTKNPTFVSPLVTNGVVFSGHVTDTGKPYTYSDFGGPSKTPLAPSGMLTALDADTGNCSGSSTSADSVVLAVHQSGTDISLSRSEVSRYPIMPDMSWLSGFREVKLLCILHLFFLNTRMSTGFQEVTQYKLWGASVHAPQTPAGRRLLPRSGGINNVCFFFKTRTNLRGIAVI